MTADPSDPADADADALRALQALADSRPDTTPQARPVWTALVDVGEREALGVSGAGERFIVPITGGRFWGAPGHASLTGVVRPGGADRQVLRPDGVRLLHALYEMQTADGAVLTIDNRVIVDETAQPARYAVSCIAVSAPEGPHAWLNRRLFVGTLQTLRPHRPAVVVRAYLVAG